MAPSCSTFRLSSFSYSAVDGSSGMGFPSCGSRNVVLKVKGFVYTKCQAADCRLFLKSTLFSVFFRAKESGICLKKRRCSAVVRSELQPSSKFNSSNTVVTVSKEGSNASVSKESKVVESTNYHTDLDHGNGSANFPNDGNGKFPPGGGGGGGDGNHGDNSEENKEEDEFGPLLNFEEVIREVETRGVSLPSDMLEAARTVGLQKLLLYRYFDLQASPWPLGLAIKSFAIFRNWMLVDPSFLFKVGTEIIIDSCCATFAEVHKRGKDFWAEFELFAADLLVGLVVNIALVGMLAPYARIGRPSASNNILGRIMHAYGALPSSVFEAERPGCKFSAQQRIATYFYKGLLYGAVGFACGLIGQGIANAIMTAKRNVKKSEEDIPVPPLAKSAALWGVFLAVSSNTRYQIINGLERLVEASPLARRSPPVAMAFTVGVRFANNIYGGMQFVDWARWSGVQ